MIFYVLAQNCLVTNKYCSAVLCWGFFVGPHSRGFSKKIVKLYETVIV